jgi:phage terminase large subunit-like protein
MAKNKNEPPKGDEPNHALGRKASEIEAAARKAQRYRRMDFWTPYRRQLEFINATRLHREVGLFAGTQLGKSETAAFMTACNLTGLYPKFWKGIRYDHAIDGWSVAKSLKMSRDICQVKLIGGVGEAWGTGLIPRHLLLPDPIASRGEGGAIDTIKVRHVSGNISTLRFRTYDAGREALQGSTLDWLWLDEEPDFEIYSELLSRISARPHGRLIITFTPLLGMSGISVRYRQEHSPDRTFVQMGIDDVPPARGDLDEGGDSGQGAGAAPMATFRLVSVKRLSRAIPSMSVKQEAAACRCSAAGGSTRRPRAQSSRTRIITPFQLIGAGAGVRTPASRIPSAPR